MLLNNVDETVGGDVALVVALVTTEFTKVELMANAPDAFAMALVTDCAICAGVKLVALEITAVIVANLTAAILALIYCVAK